jgi:hypothetical protein
MGAAVRGRALCEATGKTQYPERNEALLALRRLLNSPRGRPERKAYHCPHCGLWHLTKIRELRPPGKKHPAHKRPLRMPPNQRWNKQRSHHSEE